MIQTNLTPGYIDFRAFSVSDVNPVPSSSSRSDTINLGCRAHRRAAASLSEIGAGASCLSGLHGETSHQTRSSLHRFNASNET